MLIFLEIRFRHFYKELKAILTLSTQTKFFQFMPSACAIFRKKERFPKTKSKLKLKFKL